jgi:cadmium resistance protein CadD (predicted permease)
MSLLIYILAFIGAWWVAGMLHLIAILLCIKLIDSLAAPGRKEKEE